MASSNWKRADGKNVRTVRDVIAEVDADGNVIDEFRLAEILDPYRDNVLKVLDQGAVCLNIDASKAGQTLTSEDIAKLDASDKFGDIVGTARAATGRTSTPSTTTRPTTRSSSLAPPVRAHQDRSRQEGEVDHGSPEAGRPSTRTRS